VPGVDGPPVALELQRLAALGWRAATLPPDSDGVRVVDQTVDINYPDEGLAHLGLDGGRGYWFDHRARSVIDMLQAATPARAIWDVGAGAGSMSVRLAQAGYEVVSVEPQRVGAAAIAELQCSTVFCGSLESLALPERAIGVIGLFDVIEHLDDPHALIAEAVRVLEPAGVVVVTVPALPLLWSNSDDVAGHQRRYTRRSLDHFMQSCGLTRASSAYLFASLVPPAVALRTIPYRLGRRRASAEVMAATQRRLAPKPRVDAAARRVLDAERAFARHVPLPVGLSVLGAYRTPS
jgi:2-polyprenyl-3-methyl-5-hydroxy-6-metoxy-1,4-benzoquinol methylase